MYHKWRSYDVWFLRYKARRTEFFVILGHFLHFDPPNNPKKFKFWKKSLEILSFYICVSQMTSGDICFLRSGVWDSLLSFWAIFCPHNLMTTPKIKIWKNWKKKPGDIILLHMCTINQDQMMDGSWDIRREGQSFLSFWGIFCHLTLLTTRKIQLLKKWKKRLEILSFYICVP